MRRNALKATTAGDPPPARLPDGLAARVDAALARIRATLDGDAPSRRALEAVRSILVGLARDVGAAPDDAFPLDPRSRDAIYLLSEDPDRRLALYLAARDAPLETPVHDHTTWAVIAGVRGRERNRFFEQRADGGLRETGVVDVVPGSAVAMQAPELHAIATEAGVRNLQLHLYGRSFDAQRGRVVVDPATGHRTPFAGHPGIRVPAGRVTAATVRRMTLDGGELALVDLRALAAHVDDGHPIAATCVPAESLAADAARRLPNRHARIVLLDDDGLGGPARDALQAAGYTSVHVLHGGTRAWAEAGYPLFTGLNVPGKAFAEHLDHHRPVPSVDARTLAERLARGEPIAVLDCRPVAEHRRMTLPGSVGLPGCELPARLLAQVPDASTPVVVHCAGRTRGIVAARMLIEAGCPNPVEVLRDGLIGWLLAGGSLEVAGGRPSGAPLRPLPVRGAAAAVRAIDAGELEAWLADARRTVYVIDVRTADEYAAGHHPAAAWVPGGELLQRLEEVLPVRHARVVIAGDDLRARCVAAWLGCTDWAEAVVLAGPWDSVRGVPPVPPSAPRGWRPPFDEREQDPARMRAYVDWELALPAQVAQDGTLAFRDRPAVAPTEPAAR
jgi:rhodanese-related sulfurtransferase/predicted metal-dependent enzyme (double-stranded beta helix superfamily)